jgi:hypothetical protein
MWSRRAVLAAIPALAGCGRRSESAAPTTAGTPSAPPPEATYAYTHLRASGNRGLDGRGAVDDADRVEIEVSGRPAWLLGVDGSAHRWTVVLADGTATTYRLDGATATAVADHGRVSTPPLGYTADGSADVIVAPADCAEHTHPVPVDGGLLYVATDGDVVIRRGDARARLPVDAPSDARPVRVDGERYALYGGRTDRYRHGALGDDIEGSRLVVVDAAAERVAVDAELDPPMVFEGLSPLVADLDGDGADELVTTVADATNGARIRVYDAAGDELATGPVYGPGWRHQLCVAPFGPDGRPELAVVRKPHVDQVVEFYRLVDGELTVTATLSGYASHTYGSRILDGGLAADLDADGRSELLVPTADRRALAAVRRTGGGPTAAWSLSLGGSLVTNVAGTLLDDGRVAVGAGTPDGVRVWRG